MKEINTIKSSMTSLVLDLSVNSHVPVQFIAAQGPDPPAQFIVQPDPLAPPPAGSCGKGFRTTRLRTVQSKFVRISLNNLIQLSNNYSTYWYKATIGRNISCF